jgi:hypothetical protein
MPNQNNDGILFWEEDPTPVEAKASDITLSSDDKKDAPVEEDKKEEKVEAEAKTEDAPKTEDSDKKEPEVKEESKAEENAEDLDLSDLFADLDDTKSAIDDSWKILDDAAASGSMSPEQIKELQAQVWILRDINDKNEKTIKRLLNDSVDISYKNAELEAFGWVWTNPNILILSKNLEKAQAGDDKSKSKVISVLKSLYEEFTGEDLEKTKVSQQTDLLSAVDSYNSSSNPNIKSKTSNTIEWLSM